MTGPTRGYLGVLARHRIRPRARTAVVAAGGDGRVEEVRVAGLHADWTVVAGSARTVAADVVCVGFGFVPSTEVAAALGCRLVGNPNGGVRIWTDQAQATSTPGSSPPVR